MGDDKCVAGCKHFTGGEIKHHKDCFHYPQSLSQMYDKQDEVIEKLRAEVVRLTIENQNFKYPF